MADIDVSAVPLPEPAAHRVMAYGRTQHLVVREDVAQEIADKQRANALEAGIDSKACVETLFTADQMRTFGQACARAAIAGLGDPAAPAGLSAPLRSAPIPVAAGEVPSDGEWEAWAVSASKMLGIEVPFFPRPDVAAIRVMFLEWARDNLGQGYSLEVSESQFVDPVTAWCEAGFAAGIDWDRARDRHPKGESRSDEGPKALEPGRLADAPKEEAAEQPAPAAVDDAECARLYSVLKTKAEMVFHFDHTGEGNHRISLDVPWADPRSLDECDPAECLAAFDEAVAALAGEPETLAVEPFFPWKYGRVIDKPEKLVWDDEGAPQGDSTP
jgi:hypothetical protein